MPEQDMSYDEIKKLAEKKMNEIKLHTIKIANHNFKQENIFVDATIAYRLLNSRINYDFYKYESIDSKCEEDNKKLILAISAWLDIYLKLAIEENNKLNAEDRHIAQELNKKIKKL